MTSTTAARTTITKAIIGARARVRLPDGSARAWQVLAALIKICVAAATVLLAWTLLVPGTLEALIMVWLGMFGATIGAWALALTRNLVATLLRTAVSAVVGIMAGAVFRLAWQATTDGDRLLAGADLDLALPPAVRWASEAIAATVAMLLLLVLCTRVKPRPDRAGPATAGFGLESPARSHTERRRVARHEAAHAVVALAGGARDVRVDTHKAFTHSGGLWCGQFFFRRLDTLSTVEANWVILQIAHAGDLVDQEVGDVYDDRSSVDFRMALTAAAGVLSTGQRPQQHTGPLTAGALMAAARERARIVLAEHRDAVDAVADALLDPKRRGPLSHEQLETKVRQRRGSGG